MINPQPKKKPIRLRGKEYQEFRKEVHDREHGICAVCGLPAPLDGFNPGTVFHRKSRGSGGEDSHDNCDWVCLKCHIRKHGPQWSGSIGE